MNNSGPTAQIIEREGFKTSLDFVGHRKAITVVVSGLQFLKRYLMISFILIEHRLAFFPFLYGVLDKRLHLIV